MKGGKKLPWPLTIDEAVDRLMLRLEDHEQENIRNMPEDDLIGLHHSLGQYIRNRFGLWHGNHALMEACKACHPDEASGIIIEALRKHLEAELPADPTWQQRMDEENSPERHFQRAVEEMWFYSYWCRLAESSMLLVDRLPAGDVYYCWTPTIQLWVVFSDHHLIVAEVSGEQQDELRNRIALWVQALEGDRFPASADPEIWGRPVYGVVILDRRANHMRVGWAINGTWAGQLSQGPMPVEWSRVPPHWTGKWRLVF